MRFSQVRTGDDLRQGGRHVRLLLLACERPLSYTPSLIPSLRTNTYTHMLLCALLCPALRCPALPGQARPGQARPGQARPGQARPGQARPGQARPAKHRSEMLWLDLLADRAGCWLLATGWLSAGKLAPRHGHPRADESVSLGKETRLFAPFIYINDHFTKTGSGQT
jgi:hypothetical protein